MKREEKLMVGVLILITILVIIVGIVMSINKGKKENKDNNVVAREENRVVEEFVDLREDGTKVNKSSKLHEKKTYDGLEIGNLQLTMKDNVSVILGEIKNVSNIAKGEYPISLVMLDKEGNEIITIGAYIQKLEPGQTAELNTSATFDFANAYDFKITKR